MLTQIETATTDITLLENNVAYYLANSSSPFYSFRLSLPLPPVLSPLSFILFFFFFSFIHFYSTNPLCVPARCWNLA